MAPIQATQGLERFVRDRRETDTRLVSYGLYFFLLSWITLGIYPIVVFYRRCARMDRFSERKKNYYMAVLEYTRQFAEQADAYDAVHSEVQDLDGTVKHQFIADLRPVNAGLSTVLAVVTFGLYGWYVLYRHDRFWWDAQTFEQDFDEKISQVWTKLGSAVPDLLQTR